MKVQRVNRPYNPVFAPVSDDLSRQGPILPQVAPFYLVYPAFLTFTHPVLTDTSTHILALSWPILKS